MEKRYCEICAGLIGTMSLAAYNAADRCCDICNEKNLSAGQEKMAQFELQSYCN